MSSQAQLIHRALSESRIATYERASVSEADYLPEAALSLYDWNAQVSAAFLAPLHICEVVIRNAVAEALEEVYGTRWPWSSVFEHSLPAPTNGYNPRKDLQQVRVRYQTAGKVIPELKFVFWQKMFTRRHDDRLWNRHLTAVFPNLDSRRTVSQRRKGIYDDLEHIRLLRNRIAHHEPIFRRPLHEELNKITALIQSRCSATASWVTSTQRVTALFR